MSVWHERVHPPKPSTEEGHCVLPTATSMFSVKSTPNHILQHLACSLDASQPFRFFFACVWRVHKSDQNWGVSKYPFFACLPKGIPRRLLLGEGSLPFWYDFTPFWHVADWCAPDWLKNTAGGRLFQLVIVVKGLRPTSKLSASKM